MPSAANANKNMPKPIPLRFKAARRFYEPILLEVAIKNIRPQNDFSASQHAPNTMRDNVDSAEQTFKCFVNRLAQVCDNQRGENGSTVSGIAVLEEPEGVRYIIGSNNRRGSKLEEVDLFVKQLLKIVAESIRRPVDSGYPVHREALWHVLGFNENRIAFYLANTVEYLDTCIGLYDKRNGEKPLASEASKFRTQLSKLAELVKFEKETQLERPRYFAACEQLFLFIHNAQRRKFGDFISEQAREGQIDSSKQWMELRHFVGRLHSYYLAIETIIRAGRLWQRLCHDFKVTVIPSAPVIPHPLRTKRPVANEIVGRMTSSEYLKAQYRALADGLQEFDLDEEILRECNNSSPTHMVHAEVLVLDYVLDYLHGSSDSGFWKNWRYIGCSKPTCRLCNYYFENHPGGVQVRETHHNLYPNWRVPYVFNEGGMKATERLLNAMNEKTRADAVRSLQTQIPRGRKHDSNSFSEQPWPQSHKTDTSVSELVSGITNLAIPDTIEEEDGRSTAGEPDYQEEEEEEEEEEKEEEEEEGIIVFRGRKPLPSRS